MIGDALQVRLRVRIVRQGSRASLIRVAASADRVRGARPVDVLEAREEDEVALAGEMLDPAAVESRVHGAPGMQEDHDRTRLAAAPAAWKTKVPALAVPIARLITSVTL